MEMDMLKTNSKRLVLGVLIGIFITFTLAYMANAAQENVDRCELGQNCIIRESTYNDTYDVYNSQNCTLNITFQNGTVMLENALMENGTLGYGVHNYTYVPYAEGYYFVEIYCNFSGDDGYISKDFICDDKTLDDISSEISVLDIRGGNGGGIPINAITGLEVELGGIHGALGNITTILDYQMTPIRVLSGPIGLIILIIIAVLMAVYIRAKRIANKGKRRKRETEILEKELKRRKYA